VLSRYEMVMNHDVTGSISHDDKKKRPRSVWFFLFKLSKKLCRKLKNKKLHKAGKAPSGRELDFAKQKTEGECVNIKFDQNFK